MRIVVSVDASFISYSTSDGPQIATDQMGGLVLPKTSVCRDCVDVVGRDVELQRLDLRGERMQVRVQVSMMGLLLMRWPKGWGLLGGVSPRQWWPITICAILEGW